MAHTSTPTTGPSYGNLSDGGMVSNVDLDEEIPSTPPKNPIPSDPYEKVRQDADTAIRLNETANIIGSSVGVSTLIPFWNRASNGDYIKVWYNFIGTMFGIAISLGWVLVLKLLPTKKARDYWRTLILPDKLNPWSRRFKTMFVLGLKIGDIVGNVVPIPLLPGGHTITNKIFSTLIGYTCGLVLGLTGLIFFRVDFLNYFKKRDWEDTLKKYFEFGVEGDGWSKYVKRVIVWSSHIGTIVGAIIGLFFFSPEIGIVIGSAIGGLFGFLLGTILIPIGNVIKYHVAPRIKNLINKYFPKKSPPDDSSSKETLVKEKSFVERFIAKFYSDYKTNQIRAGMAFAGAIGGVAGALIGAFLLPGLGAIAGAAIGNAIGAVIGGLLFGFVGPVISHYFFGSVDTGNSPDYAFRTGSLVGSKQGIAPAITAKIPSDYNPIVPEAGVLITGLFGVGREFFYRQYVKFRSKKAKPSSIFNDPEYVKDHILPWTQRMATGIIIGSAIGSFIGMFAFPGIGIPIGSAIGAVVGASLAIAIVPLFKWLGLTPKPAPKPPLNEDIIPQASEELINRRELIIDDESLSKDIKSDLLIQSEASFSRPAVEKDRQSQANIITVLKNQPIPFNPPRTLLEDDFEDEAPLSDGIVVPASVYAEWQRNKPPQQRVNNPSFSTDSSDAVIRLPINPISSSEPSRASNDTPNFFKSVNDAAHSSILTKYQTSVKAIEQESRGNGLEVTCH